MCTKSHCSALQGDAKADLAGSNINKQVYEHTRQASHGPLTGVLGYSVIVIIVLKGQILITHHTSAVLSSAVRLGRTLGRAACLRPTLLD